MYSRFVWFVCIWWRSIIKKSESKRNVIWDDRKVYAYLIRSNSLFLTFCFLSFAWNRVDRKFSLWRKTIFFSFHWKLSAMRPFDRIKCNKSYFRLAKKIEFCQSKRIRKWGWGMLLMKLNSLTRIYMIFIRHLLSVNKHFGNWYNTFQSLCYDNNWIYICAIPWNRSCAHLFSLLRANNHCFRK